MPGTADRDEEEGGLDGDALFIKELQKQEGKGQRNSHVHTSITHDIRKVGANKRPFMDEHLTAVARATEQASILTGREL